MGSKFTFGNMPSEVMDRNREVTENFYRLLVSRVHHLVMKPNKWNTTDPRTLEVNDLVTGDQWKIGRVTAVTDTKASIAYSRQHEKSRVLKIGVVERSFRQIAILASEGEVFLNSNEFRTQD